MTKYDIFIQIRWYDQIVVGETAKSIIKVLFL